MDKLTIVSILMALSCAMIYLMSWIMYKADARETYKKLETKEIKLKPPEL